MNTTAFAASAQQLVIDYLRTTFGVAAEGVDVLALAPRDLPAGAAEFYVEAKGGYDKRNCVVAGGKVYCSGADGEFARLLREQGLLDRADLSAVQLMRLYALFALPRQLKYIDAHVIARNPQAYAGFADVAAPSLARRADGTLALTFFATPVDTVQPSKWTVTVTRSFQVEAISEPALAR